MFCPNYVRTLSEILPTYVGISSELLSQNLLSFAEIFGRKSSQVSKQRSFFRTWDGQKFGHRHDLGRAKIRTRTRFGTDFGSDKFRTNFGHGQDFGRTWLRKNFRQDFGQDFGHHFGHHFRHKFEQDFGRISDRILRITQLCMTTEDVPVHVVNDRALQRIKPGTGFRTGLRTKVRTYQGSASSRITPYAVTVEQTLCPTSDIVKLLLGIEYTTTR